MVAFLCLWGVQRRLELLLFVRALCPFSILAPEVGERCCRSARGLGVSQSSYSLFAPYGYSLARHQKWDIGVVVVQEALECLKGYNLICTAQGIV